MDKHTLKWGAKFVTTLVKCTPALKQAKKIKESGSWEEYKYLVDKELYNWLNPLIEMAGVTFKVKGKEKIPQNEPIIYTPNHSGAFDIPAIILNTPKPPIFIAKKELGALPLIKDWMGVMDCVFVDRNNKDKARSSLHDAIEMVKNGRSIVVFPEGTRSKNGELGVFKGGAMKIAMETGARVVPVLLEGTRECLEETGNITPGEITVTFLEPINTKGLTKDEFFKMPEQIRQLIIDERKKQSDEA